VTSTAYVLIGPDTAWLVDFDYTEDGDVRDHRIGPDRELFGRRSAHRSS
jgi:hypothetical protein